jgi:hypothetical protein
MRYRGGGVGHTSTREATNRFLEDRHPTDMAGVDDEPETLDECQEAPLQMDDDEDLGGNDEEEEDYGYGGAGDMDEEELEQIAEEDILQGAEEALLVDEDEIEDEVEQFGYARY